jgi:hypothetical protein
MKPVLLIFNNSNREQHHKLFVCVVLLLSTVVVAVGFISIRVSGGALAKASASTRRSWPHDGKTPLPAAATTATQ